MPRSRAPVLLILLLLAALAPSAASAAPATRVARVPSARPVRPATPQEILSGHATRAQLLAAQRLSVQRAGGTAIQAAPITVSLAGGSLWPLMSVDLDGDGDQEILVRQYTDDRDYLLATDADGVLWRQVIPNHLYTYGAFVGDFAPDPGSDVLFVNDRYSGNHDETLLALVGAGGLVWTQTEPSSYVRLNGLVQADGDAQKEFAYTAIENGPTVVTRDGATGAAIGSLTSSVDAALGTTDAFVTDGPSGQPDEAVFLSTLPLSDGYYAETRSLAGGAVVDRHVEPAGSYLYLTQGPDYTGDGRRDALIESYNQDDSSTIGVFDPSTFKVAWTKQRSSDGFGGAFSGGGPSAPDIDGDHGAEVCLSGESRAGTRATVTIECDSGKTGTKIWSADRSIQSHDTGDHADAYAYAYPATDVDGDGILDYFIFGSAYSCTDVPGEESWDCTTDEELTDGISGKTGAPLWTAAPAERDLYAFAGADLDGTAGADIYDGASQLDDGQHPAAATFDVLNGLTFGKAWSGTIPTNGLPGETYSPISADVDGDGTADVVAAATGYEQQCGPMGKHCWEVEHAFLAGFVGRQLAWSYEL